MRSIPWVLAALMWCAAGSGPALALTAADWVRLQAAGIGPGVIQALVEEKAVETGVLRIEELLALKTAGVADETLSLVIRAGSFLRDRKPRVYGSRLQSVRLATIEDLLKLKAAGFNEQTLRAVILSGSEGAEAVQRQEALAWLEKMGLRVDMREIQP